MKVKKIFLLFVLLATSIFCEEDFGISPSLLFILKQTGISDDGSLDSIINATQKEQPNGWMRKAGKERWQIDSYFQDKYKTLKPHFLDLELINKIKPEESWYKYAVWCGGAIHRIRNRLAYLKKLWLEGVRFEQIVVLSGQRKLDPEIESKNILLKEPENLPFKKDWQFNGNVPKTEIDLMRFVFEQSELPREMKKLPIVWVNAPGSFDENGTFKRPSTTDTVSEWMKLNPEPGITLVISNQPYIQYQDCVFEALLPDDFYLETVGSGTSFEDLNCSILLDTMARWLYTAQKLSTK